MFYQFNHLASPDYLKIESGINFSYPPHLHQCFELIILLSGKMQVTVDAQVFELNKNEALIVFPNQIHSLHSIKSEHILCIFAPDLVREYAAGLSGKVPQDNSFIPDPYFVEALCKLSPDSTTTYKKGILYSLCAQFDQNKSYEIRQTDNDKLLNKIFAFVEESYLADCSLKKLAEKTGYDYAYLSRIFRKIVGISYNSYVNHCRLNHACYLMVNTDFPIIQCALESGYDSVRSFNRNFKTYFGVTPTEYRDNHKKNNVNDSLITKS